MISGTRSRRCRCRNSGTCGAGIAAAAVGVILNLSAWFALNVLFGKLIEMHLGPMRWYAI
jgi:hypothetical protein